LYTDYWTIKGKREGEMRKRVEEREREEQE
jgi:hypothetical protein